MRTRRENKCHLRRFYLGVFSSLAFFAAYFAFASSLLVKSGEYMPLQEILARLEKTDGTYGSALNERTFWFKQHIYRHYKPDVAALGSSRVLLFRKAQFATSFVNLGMMRNLDDDVEISHTLFDEHPPKVLILGIDYWWFHPLAEEIHHDRSPVVEKLSMRDLIQPAKWLLGGKLPIHHAWGILTQEQRDAGISGILRQDGFDRFGSFRYTSTYNGETKLSDTYFKAALDKLTHADKAYARGNKLSAVQWDKLVKLLDYLHSKKAHVVLFMPPLAPTIDAAMKKTGEDFSYIETLNKKLALVAKQRSFSYFDLRDAKALGSHDCEFVDGVHGGDITYDRILLTMAKRDTVLANRVDTARITQEISSAHGNASLLKTGEVDFLKLGCERSSR